MRVEASPRSRAAKLAVEIYSEVLEQVRGDRLVLQAMSRDGDRLVVQDRAFDLAAFKRVHIVSIGKAAYSMAVAGASVLGDRLSGCLIVTKRGHAEAAPGIEVIEAGHPIPDENSLLAGQRVLDLARTCDEDAFVVVLLSGGASALMEAPAGDISLDDLRQTNEALLASGADIRVVNAVRSRISKIKGGGLSRAFAPATVIVLALSDVVGNSLATIGSGPFTDAGPFTGFWSNPQVPDGLLGKLPSTVRTEVLSADLLPKPTPSVPHFVIGSVSLAVHAAADAAKRRGLEAYPYQDPMKGEAREMARKIMSVALRPALTESGLCLIFGGETTVVLGKNASAKGGRCQEMAVAAAPSVARLSGSAFLAAGTDGTDGPTDAAGGLVEPDSLTLARAEGISYRTALGRHESYRFLEATGGLLRTGATGSNVNDLSLFVVA